jgi:hypothetical protein
VLFGNPTTDNKVNVIFSVFSLVIGMLSVAVWWAMWKLMDRPRWQRQQSKLSQGPLILESTDIPRRFGP